MSDYDNQRTEGGDNYLELQKDGESDFKTAGHTAVSDPNQDSGIDQNLDINQATGNDTSGSYDDSSNQRDTSGGSYGDDSTSSGNYDNNTTSGGSYDNTTSGGSYDNTTSGGSYDNTTSGGSYDNNTSGGSYDNTSGDSSGDTSGSYDNTSGDTSEQRDTSGDGDDSGEGRESKKSGGRAMENVDAIPTAGGERLGEKHWGESKIVADVPKSKEEENVSSKDGQPDQQTKDNTARNAGGNGDDYDDGEGKKGFMDKIKDKLPIGGNKE